MGLTHLIQMLSLILCQNLQPFLIPWPLQLYVFSFSLSEIVSDSLSNSTVFSYSLPKILISKFQSHSIKIEDFKIILLILLAPIGGEWEYLTYYSECLKIWPRC